MSDLFLIGVDIGTTICKAAIFSRSGKQIALAYREYPLIKISGKKIEQDAEVWWTLVKETIKECVNKLTNSERKSIKAISISAQGISFVPIDNKGIPISNAITWLDSRAEEEAKILVETFGMDAIYKKTGIQANPFYILPKIMWLKKNRPDIYNKTYRFCTCLDFLTFRFAGKFIIDYSIAGGSLLHDVQKLDWSEELLEMAELTRDKLPELDWAGSVIGPILEEVAEVLGIPKETDIVLGGHDQECAGIGAGLQAGEITISLGTASILLVCIDKPLFDKKMRIPCLPSVERDRWVMEAVVNVGGAGLKWVCELINEFSKTLSCKAIKIPLLNYKRVSEIAKTIGNGAGGIFFYPHMSGATSPYWISSAKGVFHGISLSTTMAHLLRAVLEGWVFQIKTNLLTLKELTYDPEEVIVFGGGARDPFMLQLTADILGKPVIILNTIETALLGACILAAVGSGIYDDIVSAQNVMVKRTGYIEPIKKNTKEYSKIYKRYLKIEKAILRIDSTESK